MRPAYRWAVLTLAFGLLPLGVSIFTGFRVPVLGLLVSAIALPVTVLLVAWARLGLPIPVPAVLGGGLVAPLIALASQPLVGLFAFVFFLGFGDSGRKLFEALRLDPKLITALSSPWVVLGLIEVAAIVPFVEEFAKALGASFGKPTSRQQAFLAGVTAGCAFAALEDVLYAVAGGRFDGTWQAVVVVRMLGVAVHPLGAGLTMLGYWEWRSRGAEGALLRRYLSAAGIHMLWNGSTTVAIITAGALLASGAPAQYHAVALSYTAVLGVLLAVVLWQVTQTVADGDSGVLRWRLNRGEALAAWTLLAGSMLVPVSILVLAFPRFYLG